MQIGAIVQWTKGKLSELVGADVPITTSDSLDALTLGPTVTPPSDLFESESEYRLLVDVPGASPANVQLTWNEGESLLVHVRRAATDVGVPLVCEYAEANWYRELRLPADADGAEATAEVRQGVLAISVPKRLTLIPKLIPVYAA